jgi:predicted ATPase
VELAAIGADGDVAQSTLAGLGLRDALLGGAPNAEPAERLIAAIREREALLILGNCEHVIESAAAFAHRVLGECRRLRILSVAAIGKAEDERYVRAPGAELVEVMVRYAEQLAHDGHGSWLAKSLTNSQLWTVAN